MPTLSDVGRLGRDAELRYTPDGKAVCNLALACDYGRKGSDGKRPAQWVDAALWGAQAEAMTPYLLKGQQLNFTIDDAHIETFEKSDGSQGVKLVGRVIAIKFVGSPPQQDQSQQQSRPAQRSAPQNSQSQRQAPRQAQQSAPQPEAGYDSFDDDIPFMDPYHGRRCLVI